MDYNLIDPAILVQDGLAETGPAAPQAATYPVPTHLAPAQQAPAYPAPSYISSVYQAPVHQALAYQTPVYHALAYQDQPYQAPAYQAPDYHAPAFRAAGQPAPGHLVSAAPQTATLKWIKQNRGGKPWTRASKQVVETDNWTPDERAAKALKKALRRYNKDGCDLTHAYLFICAEPGCNVTKTRLDELSRHRDTGHSDEGFCVTVQTFLSDAGLNAARWADSFESYYRLLKPGCRNEEIEFYKSLHLVYERNGRNGKGGYKFQPVPTVALMPAPATEVKYRELPINDVDYAAMGSS